MKDEEAISKAASSVEVIGEKPKHPHVVQATRWRLMKKKQPRLSLYLSRKVRESEHLSTTGRLWERGRDQDLSEEEYKVCW
ncbi:hypothetical protein Bca101_020139 [Brassica carinata]